MSQARAAAVPRLESGDGFQQFLNPASMLTPGFAGALTMMITNALVQQFPVEPGYAGLGVSFLFGTLLFARKGPVWTRCVYYVLNSLVIFCVAMGANHAGIAASTIDTPAEPAGIHANAPAAAPAPELASPPAPVASAAGNVASDMRMRGVHLSSDPGNQQLAEDKRRLEQEAQQLRAEVARLKAASDAQDAAAQQARTRFFKPWFQQPAPTR
jgi:hypothetical protein